MEIFDGVNGSCFQVASEFQFLTLNDKQKAKFRLRQSLSEVISTIKFAFFCNSLEPVERKRVRSSSTNFPGINFYKLILNTRFEESFFLSYSDYFKVYIVGFICI